MDSVVHGILQARTLEWVVCPFSSGSSNPGIKPGSPALLVDSVPAELSGKMRRTDNTKHLEISSQFQSVFTSTLKASVPILSLLFVDTEP